MRISQKSRLLVLALVLAGNVEGQDRAPQRPQQPFQNLPGGIDGPVAALGDRLRKPDKEKLVLSGSLEDRERRIPVRITFQLPALVRIEGLNPGGIPVAFDGVRAERQNPLFENLLETLSEDTPEGMFASIRENAAVVLLGRRFGPRARDDSGPRYDIYEVTGPVRSRFESVTRLKRYFFDSKTELLAMTRYTDDVRRQEVEVRFSDWQVADGSAFPGRIERYEGNQLVFSLVLTAASTGPWQDPVRYPALEEPVGSEVLAKER